MTKKKKKSQKNKSKSKKLQQQKQAVAFDVEKKKDNQLAKKKETKEKVEVKETKQKIEAKPTKKEDTKQKKEIVKVETDNKTIDKKEEKARVPYLSYIRAIAAVAIVLLHSAFAYAGIEGVASTTVKVAMTIRNCFLWAVPLFVMVSGALLLDPKKEISYKDIFYKYIKRILILIVVFTLINEAFDVLLLGKRYETAFVLEYIKKALTDGSWPHMWYLYMLIGLYLLLPIYRLAVKNMQQKDYQYLLIVYFIFLSVQPFIQSIFHVQSAFYIMATTIYPFYFFAGYAIDKEYIQIPKKYAIGGVVVGLLVTAFSTMYLKDYSFIHYSFPFVILQSLCLFALFKNQKGLEKFDKVLAQMDYVSLGVYLLHLYAIRFLFTIVGMNQSIWMIIPVACISYMFSYICTYVYKRIG